MSLVRIIGLIMLLPIAQSVAGTETVDYRKLLKGLEIELQQGQKRALRDLGSLLDKSEIRKEVLHLLFNATLFLREEIHLSDTTSKKNFLDFYYSNEKRILYSDLFDAFYITPLESWPKTGLTARPLKVDQQDKSIQLRQLVDELEIAVSQQNWKKGEQIALSIASLGVKEGQQTLQEVLLVEGDRAKSSFDQKICELLVEFPERNTVTLILQKIQDQVLTPEFAAPILRCITNNSISSYRDADELIEGYANLLDSIDFFEALRAYGYEKNFPFNSSFFPEEVDYFGRILTRSGNRYWVEHNAIRDLLAVNNSKALFYMAAYLYKKRDQLAKDPRLQATQKLLTRVSHIEITADDEFKAQYSFPSTDLFYQLLYWSQHYLEYEWDENQRVFINKKLQAEKTESYERLFRRLKSRNDSVAIASFRLLTEGNPKEIIRLGEKYRQLLRSHNDAIPSMKYNYLEQMAKLTDFCRRNNLSYEAPEALQNLFEELKRAESARERYRIENLLIDQLDLTSITAFEYWALLHENHPHIPYSAGRILDWFYSSHWIQIVDDEDQLRYYLKKALLFEQIGIYGICNSYLNKFRLITAHHLFQYRIQRLLLTESDEEIRHQIEQLIIIKEEESEEAEDEGLSKEAFLVDPQLFSRREITVLPAPFPEDSMVLLQAIRAQSDPVALRRLLEYLSLHPSLDIVPVLGPLLFDDRLLIKEDTFEFRVADRVVPILEEIYSYQFEPTAAGAFTTAEWQDLWQRKGGEYRKWRQQFFLDQMNWVLSQKNLSIEDLNSLTESLDYDSIYIGKILAALPKLKPLKDIRKLAIPHLLSLKQDLQYFTSLEYDSKILDDVPKMFNITDANLMLDFLAGHTGHFDLTDQGTFYNNLFQNNWMLNAVYNGTISNSHAERIMDLLDQYLHESDFISEYEEQRTILNIGRLSNIGLSLEEKLKATFTIDADHTSKAKLQSSILAQISYEEIGKVLPFLDQLHIPNVYEFLSRDFGIPVFELDDYKTFSNFKENYSKMTEAELYRHYLEDFGVKFSQENGELDYLMIYRILKFDNVSPFVGSGGQYRDWYCYGIIKLLEYQFATRLGFGKKLNESQEFVSFSTSKRAIAWRQFLLDNGKVVPHQLWAPSFNQMWED